MAEPAQDYTAHWDRKFATRPWGRYPPEDLVRFLGRRYRDANKGEVRVLEVGCGPGANLWFMHREGFAVHGIDASPAAIEIAGERLARENAECAAPAPDLRVGNFQQLPWSDAQMDVVVDVFAIYANTVSVIDRVLAEVHRVLVPGGLFYSKLWGRATTGCGEGLMLEEGTFDRIPRGPCHDMGVSHFFSAQEIELRFGRWFEIVGIEQVRRHELRGDLLIEEFHGQFRKAP